MSTPNPVSIRGQLQITMESALLIAGRGSPGSIFDAITARTPQGEALIPSSALKGALREACQRLALAQKRPVCTAGKPCSANVKTACVICQLFGTPGPDRPGLILSQEATPMTDIGQQGGLRFCDAVAKGAAKLSTRPSVAIDRRTGAASEGMLAMVQVAEPSPAPLSAALEGVVSEDAWELFTEALQLVTGIGHNRTRGMGQVQVTFENTSTPMRPGISLEQKLDDIAFVRVTLLEPLVLGRTGAGSIVRTEDRIAGSSLRGAIATAVLRGGVRPDNPDFQRLFVAPETCLRFSDALPTTERGELPLPLPLTTLCCKHHPHFEGERPEHQDTLLRYVLAAKVLEAGGVPLSLTCQDPKCGGPLKHPGGMVNPVRPSRRILTRLARDYRTGSFMPSMLFSVEQLLPAKDLVFTGTVAELDDAARGLLAKAGAIYLGRGRSQGQGRVEVEIGRASSLNKAVLERRWKTFAEKAKHLLKIARAAGAQGLPEDANDLVAVVARTDLHPDVDRLQQAIFRDTPAEVLWAQQKVGQRGGWDQGYAPSTPPESAPSPKPRTLVPVVRAGSVWLFHCKGPRPTAEHLNNLERLGIDAGDPRWGRHLGMGQVTFFPDVLLKGWGS